MHYIRTYLLISSKSESDPLRVQYIYIYKHVIFAANCVKTLYLSEGAFSVNAATR